MSFSYDKFNDTETERREKDWREAQNKANTSLKRGIGSRFRYDVDPKTGRSESVFVNPFVSDGDGSSFQQRGRREAIELGAKKSNKSSRAKDDPSGLDSKISTNVITDFRRVLLGSVPEDFKEEVLDESATAVQTKSILKKENKNPDDATQQTAALSLLKNSYDDDEDVQMLSTSHEISDKQEIKTSDDLVPTSSFCDFKKEFERKYASKLSPPSEEEISKDWQLSQQEPGNIEELSMLSVSQHLDTFISAKQDTLSPSSTQHTAIRSSDTGILNTLAPGTQTDKISEREQFLKNKLKQFLGLPHSKEVNPAIFERMPDGMIADFLKYLTSQQSHEISERETEDKRLSSRRNIIVERQMVTRKRPPHPKELSSIHSLRKSVKEEDLRSSMKQKGAIGLSNNNSTEKFQRYKKHASSVFASGYANDPYESPDEIHSDEEISLQPRTENIYDRFSSGFSAEKYDNEGLSRNRDFEMLLKDEISVGVRQTFHEGGIPDMSNWSREITVERRGDRHRGDSQDRGDRTSKSRNKHFSPSYSSYRDSRHELTSNRRVFSEEEKQRHPKEIGDRCSGEERHEKRISRKRRKSHDHSREKCYSSHSVLKQRSPDDGKKQLKNKRSSSDRIHSRKKHKKGRHRHNSRSYSSYSSDSEHEFRVIHEKRSHIWDYRFEQDEQRDLDRNYSESNLWCDSGYPQYTEQSHGPYSSDQHLDYNQHDVNQTMNYQISPGMFPPHRYSVPTSQIFHPVGQPSMQNLQIYQGMYHHAIPYGMTYDYTTPPPDQSLSNSFSTAQNIYPNMNNYCLTESLKPLKAVLVGHSILQQIKDVIGNEQGTELQMYSQFGFKNVYVDILSPRSSTFLVEELGCGYMDRIVKDNPDIVLLMVGENNIDSVTFSLDHLIHEITQVVLKLIDMFKVKCVVVCELLSKKKPMWISPEDFKSRKSKINLKLEQQFFTNPSVMFWKHKSVWERLAGEGNQAEHNKIIYCFYESIQHALLRAISVCVKKDIGNKLSQVNYSADVNENQDFSGQAPTSSVIQPKSEKVLVSSNFSSADGGRAIELSSTLDKIQYPEVNSSKHVVKSFQSIPHSTEVPESITTSSSELQKGIKAAAERSSDGSSIINDLDLTHQHKQARHRPGSEFTKTIVATKEKKIFKMKEYRVTVLGHQLADYLKEGLLNGMEFGMLDNFGFDQLKVEIIGRQKFPKTLKEFVNGGLEILFENRPDVVLLMLGESDIDSNLYSASGFFADYDRLILWLKDKLHVTCIILYEILANQFPYVITSDEYEKRREEINRQFATKYATSPQIMFWKHSTLSKPFLQDFQKFENVCKLYKNVQNSLAAFVKLRSVDESSDNNNMVSEGSRCISNDELSLKTAIGLKCDQTENTLKGKGLVSEPSSTEDQLKVLILGHDFVDFIREMADKRLEYGTTKNFGLTNVKIEINPPNSCPNTLKDLLSFPLEHIFKSSPDIVILMIGENDIDSKDFDADTFLQNIRTLISRFQNSFSVSFILVCEILPRICPAMIRRDQFQFRRIMINDLLEKEFKNNRVVMYWPHNHLCRKNKKLKQFDRIENLMKLFESVKAAVQKTMGRIREIIVECSQSKYWKDSLYNDFSEQLDESVKSYYLWKQKYPKYVNMIEECEKSNQTNNRKGKFMKVVKVPILDGVVLKKQNKIFKVSIIGHTIIDCLREVINSEDSNYQTNFGFQEFSIELFGPSQSPSTIRELATSSLQKFIDNEPDFVLIMLGESDLDSFIYSLDDFKDNIRQIISKLRTLCPSVRIIIWEILPKFELSAVSEKTYTSRKMVVNQCLKEEIADNNYVTFYKCKDIQKDVLSVVPLKEKVDGLYRNVRRTLHTARDTIIIMNSLNTSTEN